MPMPKHFAINDGNGNYLIADGANLRFASTDRTIQAAQFHSTLSSSVDRKLIYNITSDSTGKYWTSAAKDWITASADKPENTETSFELIIQEKNKYALRNVGKNLLCRKGTSPGVTDGLLPNVRANIYPIPEEALFHVEELP